MRIEQAYRPGALTCAVTDPVIEVARAMTSAHVGALAVLDGNMIVGVISERDVVRAVADEVDMAAATAAAFASRHVETAKLDDDTAQVARRMVDAGIRHLPVVRGRTVVGMISMRDIVAIESWL